MTGWLLAANSALLYGLSDVAGGLAARRAHFAVVALLGQVAGLVVTAATCLLAGAGPPAPGDLMWGAVSGAGTATGMVFLFRGLAQGAMSVVVPTSAVTGLAVPVVVEGVLGARPSLAGWAGTVVAVPALWLVSGGRSVNSAGVGDGLCAGIGIGVQYLALAQASAGSHLWPVTAGRVSAVAVLAVVLVVLLRRTTMRRTSPPASALALVSGVTAAAALAAYLEATHREITAVAVAVSSLYPVVPVLLGIAVFREPLTRGRVAGLVTAAAAITLLAF